MKTIFLFTFLLATCLAEIRSRPWKDEQCRQGGRDLCAALDCEYLGMGWVKEKYKDHGDWRFDHPCIHRKTGGSWTRCYGGLFAVEYASHIEKDCAARELVWNGIKHDCGNYHFAGKCEYKNGHIPHIKEYKTTWTTKAYSDDMVVDGNRDHAIINECNYHGLRYNEEYTMHSNSRYSGKCVPRSEPSWTLCHQDVKPRAQHLETIADECARRGLYFNPHRTKDCGDWKVAGWCEKPKGSDIQFYCHYTNGDGDSDYEVKVEEFMTVRDCELHCFQKGYDGVTVLQNTPYGPCYCERGMDGVLPDKGKYKSCKIVRTQSSEASVAIMSNIADAISSPNFVAFLLLCTCCVLGYYIGKRKNKFNYEILPEDQKVELANYQQE